MRSLAVRKEEIRQSDVRPKVTYASHAHPMHAAVLQTTCNARQHHL